MVAPTPQQTNAMASRYLKRYKEKYDAVPRDFNRYRDKWGFQGMISDYGYERAQEIIDFYFTTSRYGHPSSYLLYNYDKLNGTMIEIEEDEAERKKLREESKIRVAEWHRKSGEQNGQQRSSIT